jgi:beta-1,4-mannosyl-glycoprotein beta-1,4-N-acetylglucosaminyltransferase
MKIYDCFIFNHELDLLELRLNILNDYVDYFVLTESTTTFSGKLKDLHYLKNKKRFKKFHEKIIYNKVDIPNFPTSWDREIYSRNHSIGNIDYLDDDIIIASDIDEIPRPEIVEKLNSILKDDHHLTFKHNCYVYYLNNFDTNNWYGTRAGRYSYIKNTTIDDMRESTENISLISGPIVENGGWHFTSCGDSNFIKNKISSYSHTEYDNEYIKDNIENNVNLNNDIFFRNKQYTVVDIDNTFPQYLIDNLDKYKKVIK